MIIITIINIINEKFIQIVFMNWVLATLVILASVTPALALGNYEIVAERFADPFSIDISAMRPIESCR